MALLAVDSEKLNSGCLMEELVWAETKRSQILKLTVNLTNRDLIGCFCSSLSITVSIHCQDKSSIHPAA